MLRPIFAVLVSLMFAVSTAVAQTADPAAPAAPVTGGGIADWWWLIVVVILIVAVIWYFVRGRGTTGRI